MLRWVVFVPQELLLSGVPVVDGVAGRCEERLDGLVAIWGCSFLLVGKTSLLRILDLGVGVRLGT